MERSCYPKGGRKFEWPLFFSAMICIECSMFLKGGATVELSPFLPSFRLLKGKGGRKFEALLLATTMKGGRKFDSLVRLVASFTKVPCERWKKI